MYLLLHVDSPGDNTAGKLLSDAINFITWQSSGTKQHTHASILVDPAKKEIIEAYYPKVHRKILADSDLPNIDVLEIPGLDEAKALDFLEKQIGKPYSIDGLFKFAFELAHTDEGKAYFCSELAFCAIQAGGVNLFSRCQDFKVSPGLLWISPQVNYLGVLKDVLPTLK